MRLVMPRLYVILDAGRMPGPVLEIATQLMDAGVKLLQYRAKVMPARELLRVSEELAGLAREKDTMFVVNDRPDVAYLAGAHGVHVGQDDLGVEQARAVAGSGLWVGVSTHNREQFSQAATSSADYIAIGPIFETSSKVNPGPVVGTGLIRELRGVTKKPIVAIGGICLQKAAEVIEAGADSVAVIGDILSTPDPAAKARQFLDRLEAAKPAAGH